MAEFTASPDVSGFTPPNQLFNLPADIQAGQTIQQNQLLNQGKQIDLANANMAQVGQAAAGLLSAYPDEASRAAAYPKVVGMLQSQGVAMNAPATYPGEGALRAIVNASIPAKDLYSSGALLTPAQQALLGGGNTGTTTTAAPGSTTGAAAPSSVPIPARGTGGPGASASAPAEWMPYFEEASKETGIPVDLLIAQARQESSFDPNAKGTAGEIGLFQIKPSTAAAPAGMQGVDPASITGPGNVRNNIMFGARYLKAQMGGGDPNNPAVQAAALRRYNGTGPGGDPNYVQHVFGYRPTLAPSDPNAAVTAYTPPTTGATTTAAAAPPGGVAARTGGTDTAGPGAGPVAPPGSTAAPGGPPVAPQFTYPNGKVGGAPDAQGGVHYADGNYGTPPPGPRVPVAAAAPAPTPAQPGQPPAQAQPAQPPAAPAAAPAGTSRLPEASTIPTGQNSAPYKQAQAMIQEAMRYDAVAGTNPAFAKRAADLRANAAQVLQAGATVSAQQNGREGELEVVTGKFTPYQALPSPRFTGGAAVYNKTTGGWDQPTPETQADAVQGHWGVSGSGAPQFFPEASVPPHANYDIALEDLKKDRGEIASIGDAGRAAQNDNLRVQEMRDILTNANTGPGTETAARLRAWVARWTPGELSKWDGSGANLSNPAAIEMFQKLGFVGAVTQERGSTPRGGYQATKLFQQFNPGAQLLTSTNQGLLAQRLIANQAEEDYAQGAQDHYNTQRQRLKSPERDYEPISSFDAKWQAQRNPQVYAAAIGALGGQDPEMWSRGLNADEIKRVKDVVSRADPNAVIHMPGEGKVVLQPNGKPVPSGFKVQ